MIIKKRPVSSKVSAVSWTVVVGALVGVGGLIWAIVSHFIPKIEPVKAAPQTPAVSVPASSVTISGSGNLGVGNMNGGNITVSGTHALPIAPPASIPKIKLPSAP